MKNEYYNKLSILTKLSTNQIRDIFKIQRLLSIQDYINSLDENGNGRIEIPGYGILDINEYYEFKFTPSDEFKSDINGSRNNTNNFLKNKLKKLLGVNNE